MSHLLWGSIHPTAHNDSERHVMSDFSSPTPAAPAPTGQPASKFGWAAPAAMALGIIFLIIMFVTGSSVTCLSYGGKVVACDGPIGAFKAMAVLSLIFSLAAVVLGIMASSRAKKMMTGGRGIAITSIVVGAIIALVALVMVIGGSAIL